MTSKAKTVRVRCHAKHPSGSGGACNTILGDLPMTAVFVDIQARAPTHPDGRIGLLCSRRDCRTWNIFTEGRSRARR